MRGCTHCQWFWLQGDFPLTTVDGVYWGVLGVLVAINSVWGVGERNEEGEEPEQKVDAARCAGKLSLKTVSTFVFLGLMWSFWSSDSVSEWVGMMKQAGTSGAGEWLLLLGGLAGLYVVLVVLDVLEAKGWSPFFEERGMSFTTVASRTGLMALVLVGVGMPQVYERAGEDAASFIVSLQESRLNARDAAIEERGYYEGLMDNRGYTSQLSWSQQQQAPEEWAPIMESDLVKPGEGVLMYELLSGYTGEFKNAPFVTNEWGMRDRPYRLEKPEGVYRIALLGASYEQGAGVADSSTYENVLEDLLNAGEPGRYEVMNFAVGGYSPLQNVPVAENKVFGFQPDAVMYALYSTEERRMLMQLENIVQEGRDTGYPFLQELIVKSGAKAGMEASEIRARLKPFSQDILRWSFERIGEACRAHGVTPIALFVPTTRETGGIDPEWYGILSKMVEDAGFTLINMEGAYGKHKTDAVQLASYDQHPNVRGHRLIAERIYNELKARPTLVPLAADTPVAQE
ncbi:MAG: hypothetical protein R2834_12765 [Rhodothermales bacterium]